MLVIFLLVCTIVDSIFAFSWQIFKMQLMISATYCCCICALDMDCTIHVDMPCPVMDRKLASPCICGDFIISEFSPVVVLLLLMPNFFAISVCHFILLLDQFGLLCPNRTFLQKPSLCFLLASSDPEKFLQEFLLGKLGLKLG